MNEANFDVGLVGLGPWGQLILRDLQELGCTVHVCCRTESTAAKARSLGAASATTCLNELSAVNGAVIATPTTTHYAVTCQLLERGVPLFVEKPLCADLTQARDLEKRAGTRIFVMDKWRYHPGVLALAEIANRGELGAIQGLRCTRIGWRSKPRDTDVVYYLAPHDLSIALEVLWHLPEPVCARAERRQGIPVALTAILGRDPWLFLDISEHSHVRKREVRLICDDGVAQLPDSYSTSIRLTRAREPLEQHETEWEERLIGDEMPLRAELGAFVEHLRGGPPPKSSCNQAVEIVEALDNIHRLLAIEP